MDATKSHGFFLASFLVLMFLGDLTEACSTCPEISLQDACCKHDFVMRTLFINVRQDKNINMFTIQPVQVFKGPRQIRNARVLFSPRTICEYRHRGPLRGEEYLISGSINENRLQIKKCDLAKPWEEVTPVEKTNLNGVAGRDCSTNCAKG